jgi:hypothetical protein
MKIQKARDDNYVELTEMTDFGARGDVNSANMFRMNQQKSVIDEFKMLDIFKEE